LVARGPRIIDLDVIFYGSTVLRAAEIEIPHPRMAGRRFVLVPLAELSPALAHPVLHATVEEVLAATRDQSIVRIWKPAGGDARAK
jgi:2-amino-4-hydroxy-6-hydroxymethyldihydropteridine diphosphokinase